MASALWFVLPLMVGIPGLSGAELPFPARDVAATSAVVTVPVGLLLFVLARVFLKGKYLGLVSGYTEETVAEPARLGRFIGRMMVALGTFMLVFPLTVRVWGIAAFVLFVVVVVGFGIAVLVGTAWHEKG
jgi:hypothetical protein